MNVKFIIPQETDLPALYDVECRAHRYPWSYQLLASNFGDRYVNGALCLDGKIIGFYIADSLLDESTLMNICVDPAWQGHGYGKLLLNHYLTQTTTQGCTQWWLQVRRSNTTAQNLYLQLGYQQAGVRKNYYKSGDHHEDALVMQRVLA